MKKIFIIILSLSYIYVVGQTQKTVQNEIDIVKTKAENWFKDIYVETFFKDPYSYKLLKTIVTPVNIKNATLDSIKKVTYDIDTCSLAIEDRTMEVRQKSQKAYEENKENLEKYTEMVKTDTNETSKMYNKKRCDIYAKYALIYLSFMERIDLYNLAVEEKKRLENNLSKLTEEESEKMAYYEVKIDCYSNNSLGNQVLGRFQFPFTVNGPLGNKNGLDKVLQLNKE